jgi:hypothetical protein
VIKEEEEEEEEEKVEEEKKKKKRRRRICIGNVQSFNILYKLTKYTFPKLII